VQHAHAGLVVFFDDVVDLREKVGIFLELMIDLLEAIVARSAACEDVEALLFGCGAGDGRQRRRKQVAGGVGGRGAAADPVVGLLQLNTPRGPHSLSRARIFGAGGQQ
jgi:hypothetical protein